MHQEEHYLRQSDAINRETDNGQTILGLHQNLRHNCSAREDTAMRIWYWLSTAILSVLLSSAIAGNGTAQESSSSPTPPSLLEDNKSIDLKDLVFKNVLDRAYPKSEAKWMRSPVPVCWENPTDDNVDDRALIKQAAEQSWAAHSGLKFSGWAKCVSNNRGIRIRIADAGPHTKGLGIQLDGKPDGMVLNTTFQKWPPGDCRTTESEEDRRRCVYTIAVHEFGHAIGFAHEQTRPDTPGECTRGQPGGDIPGDTLLTPWDPNSVMNYCNDNNNGKLSDFDIYGVQVLYEKP